MHLSQGVKWFVLQILQIRRIKVMEWLEHEPDPSPDREAADTSALNLLDTTGANHIKGLNSSLYTEFAVSQLSGSIAITSMTGDHSLSVMYPGTDKPPLILSRDGHYTSAMFVIISGKEYLAATATDNIHLWNLRFQQSLHPEHRSREVQPKQRNPS